MRSASYDPVSGGTDDLFPMSRSRRLLPSPGIGSPGPTGTAPLGMPGAPTGPVNDPVRRGIASEPLSAGQDIVPQIGNIQHQALLDALRERFGGGR